VTGPLAPLLDQPAIARFDEWADRLLEPLRRQPRLGKVFHVASELGDWSLVWHLVGGGRGLRTARTAAEALELSALLGVESLLVNQGVKRLFRRPRPTTGGDERYQVRTPSTSSFPSGHASAGFFAAGILTRRSPRLAPLWYGIALVVALSRPFVRIHHASDILGGALVGAALARLARPLLREY
jgi:undecaprenyl-diphosphatase